ncbi:uncharacterized protein LOC113147467 [Cyclospora cayetanensis]|nr:uncharacterized protein LOC113147467 [Cyclospora cayetanensis]
MRGGRGGGAGGSTTRKWVRDGVERHGPVTEEPPIYPPDRHIEQAPPLDDEAANAVLTYRLLTNHWRTGECCIVENHTKLEGRNYSSLNLAGSYDLDAQKDAIVSYCSSEFFPTELLQNRLIRLSRVAGRGAAADSKRHKLKEMEQKENENKGADEKAPAAQPEASAEEELFGADEQDDFGGDDYAHDYYADEDVEDNMDDADDGGIL